MTKLLSNSPVVPVVAIEKNEDSIGLCESLLRGGIEAIEVTLRTENALKAIKTIKTKCPNMILGVGTVLTPKDVKAAEDAGADFLVSPGLSPVLQNAFQNTELLVLPGTASPSEALSAYEAGFDMVKLFPAEAVGGAALLRAMYSPMPKIKFMPTGGVRPSNMQDYLSLPNVYAVGGTWIAKQDDIRNGKWDLIENNAKEAMKLAQQIR